MPRQCSANGTWMSSQQEPFLYPKAATVDQVDTYFGTQVLDPYRWMEDVDSPEVAAWVAEENALTQAWLEQSPVRQTLRERLLALTDYERFSTPARYGGRYFYQHNTGLQNQAILFWQQGREGAPNLLLDPNTLSPDGTIALVGRGITDDGALMAYATAEAGSDWVTWHVRDVATGQETGDQVRWSKFSGAAWLPDNSGFFYQAYQRPAAIAAEAALKSINHFHKIYLHRLGTPQSDDLLIFHRPDDKELNLAAAVTDDGRYLIVSQSRGTSPNNQITILDLADLDAAPHKLIATEEATFDPIANDGTLFWFRTTLDAPNGKVIGIDLTRPERTAWQTLIAQTGNSLDAVTMVDDTFIAQYLAHAQSHIELHTRAGQFLRTLGLPDIGTAVGFSGKRTDTETFYTFTNFTTPGAVYRLDLATFQSVLYRAPKLAFDPSLFETTQIFADSKDGTRVPFFLTHKKGISRDGRNPTLLYGYGGFNISLQPAFSPSHILWMEQGGLYAQANLRGGGEYGEAWHHAGTGLQKQNTFDDFIACAEHLIAAGYTSPRKLAIQGGSNGGLLTAACSLQRPDLFRAAIVQVGVLDMLRFDRFTIGWAWKSDYGSPCENEAEFRALYAYSPLHNIRPGTLYPATLITTADHDDRVYPAHSFKYAAALQTSQASAQPAGLQATSPANPILIRIETRAGHGAGMPLSKRIDLTTDEFTFLLRTLAMR